MSQTSPDTDLKKATISNVSQTQEEEINTVCGTASAAESDIGSQLYADPPPRRHPIQEVDQLARWLDSSNFSDRSPAGPSSESMPVPDVDGYDVLELLGSGGMGLAYKARQKGLDRLVALKLIREGPWASDEQRRRFRVEAQAAARLQHPNMKCLEKKPQQRYPSAQALADDLGRFLNAQAILARPVGSIERVMKWVRRRPAAAALILLAALALAGFVGGMVAHNALSRTEIQRAEAEKTRADHNYQQAREAINRMLDRLNARHLADTPKLKELRRDQLEIALSYYQTVLEQLREPDSAIRQDAATAHLMTSDLQMRLGQETEAKRNVQTALEIYQQLCQEQPSVVEYRGALANCFKSLADLEEINRFENAVAYYQQADAVYQELIRDQPETRIWKTQRAKTQNQLAARYVNVRDFAKAVEYYKQAWAIHEDVLRNDPNNTELRFEIAQVAVNLALIQQTKEAFREAESRLDPLFQDDPTNVDYATTLSSTFSVLSGLSESILYHSTCGGR